MGWERRKILGMNGYIEIDRELCKGCQLCASFCPKNSIAQEEKPNAIGYLPASFNNGGECTGCAICALVCPEAVIEVYRD